MYDGNVKVELTVTELSCVRAFEMWLTVNLEGNLKS